MNSTSLWRFVVGDPQFLSTNIKNNSFEVLVKNLRKIMKNQLDNLFTIITN